MSHALRTLSFTRSPPSRLLALPPELRDLIFEFALTVSDAPLVTFRLDSYQKESMCEAVQPALTLVNRQVRAETLTIWYGCNRFVLHSEDVRAVAAEKWLLGNLPHMSLLRGLEIWVRYVTSTNERAYGALAIRIRQDGKTGLWEVEEEWGWVTVLRRPMGLENDAAFLRGDLQMMLNGKHQPSPRDWRRMLRDLSEHYEQNFG